MQQPIDNSKFVAKFEALIAEKDPTGEASRALDQAREDARATISDAQKIELKAMLAEAGRLSEAGDVNSEAAKEFIRRFQSYVAHVRRPPRAELMQNAFAETVANAQARSEALGFDPGGANLSRAGQAGDARTRRAGVSRPLRLRQPGVPLGSRN